MMRYWQRSQVWINRLRVRERVLLFIAMVAILVLVTDIFFVAKLTEQQKQLTTLIKREEADHAGRSEHLQTPQQKQENERIAILDAAILKLQIDAENTDLDIAAKTAITSSSGETGELSAVLARVLKRNDRVKLVRLLSAGGEAVTPTLPGANTGTQAGNAVAAQSQSPVTAPLSFSPPIALQRNALDITLSGSYLDIMDYLRALETAMPSLRWGSLKFLTTTVPSQMTIRVVLVAVRP